MKRRAPLVALALAGCAHPGSVALAPAPAAVPGATLFVTEAQDAIARRDAEAAVRLAELAVAAAPTEAVARATLARSYVAAGRFDAAAAEWSEVLVVRPQDAPASLGRALALLAGGNRSAAIAALDAVNGPAGDVGLAYALAGDPRGLEILGAAAKLPDARPTLRQNLALAYALAGNWGQARSVAATDMPAEAIPARLADWARMASAAPAQRVAMLLGVAPMAARVVETAPVAPATSSRAAAPMTVSFAPPHAAGAAGWVVQLGAYGSAQERVTAWNALQGLVSLKGHTPLLDRKQQWHRLSVSGFVDRLDARRLCVRLKQDGADCFVRLEAATA